MKSVLLFVALICFTGSADSCCCSAHFGMWNCFCNIFNCNCDTTSSGYCQYTDAATALTLGCIRTYPHWNELACSRNRITELQDGNNITAIHQPKDIFNLIDENRDGYISKVELWNSVQYAKESIEAQKSSAGHLQVLLAQMYSHGTFSSIFEQLDLNKNGKIEPREIDDTLEGQIKPRKVKEHSKKKMVLIHIEA